MAMVNAVCAELALGGSLANEEGLKKIRALIAYLFPPEFQQRALHVFAESAANFIPLAPQACIAMTEACMRYCARTGGHAFQQPHQDREFAHVLLSFQENLMRPGLVSAGLDVANLTAEQFRHLAKNYLAANLETDFPGLLRRHYMLFQAANPNGVLRQRAGRDARSWFAEVTGTDPGVYGAILVFVMFHGHAFRIESPSVRDLVYDINEMLSNVADDPARAYRRLHDLCVAGEFPPISDPQNWEEAVYGLHYVRRRPSLALAEARHICLHRHLLAEKLIGGPVHILTELVDSRIPPGWSSDPRNRRLRVRREFGYIFEDYVRSLLDLLFDGPEIVRRYGIARPDAGEWDALVVVGRVAMAFEFVHHPWSLNERSTGDTSAFVAHLADNIIKAGELCRHIVRERRVVDLSLEVDVVLPVVVTSEMVPVHEMTALTWQRALVEATSAEFVLGGGSVYSVQTLSLTQLENLDRLPLAANPAALAEFLATRARDELQRLSGHVRLRQSLGPNRRLKPLEEAADRSFHEIGPTLFRRPTPEEPGH